MQKLKSADSKRLLESGCQYSPSAEETFKAMIDDCKQAASPEIAAQAERLYRTYKMFAANINPAHAQALSAHIIKNTWPTLFERAVRPVTKQSIISSRVAQRKSEASMLRQKKIAEQIAWIEEQLPDISAQHPEADQESLAKILRNKWNGSALPEDRWSAKTAIRRLARSHQS